MQVNARELAFLPEPERPDWFDRELLSTAGRNRFGEPMLRAVWGNNPNLTNIAYGEKRKKYFGGKYSQMMKTEIAGDPIAQVWEDKFDIGIPRFFIEIWQPPEELGDPLEWEKARIVYVSGVRTEMMDAFPSFGRYIPWLRVQKPDGSYKSLNRDTMRIIQAGWRLMMNYEQESVDSRIKRAYSEAEDQENKIATEMFEVFHDVAKDVIKEVNRDFTMDMSPRGTKGQDADSGTN